MRQLDLAEHLGVSQATIVSLEAGRTKWNDDNIARFCVALKLDPADILRKAADVLDGAEAAQPEPVDDPLRAQLLDIYDRQDLGDMMQILGTLAKAWRPDEV